MSKVAIVTDSTAGLPRDLVEKYDIWVEPQTLILKGVSYKDQVDIQPADFYAKLEAAGEMSTTAQVTPVSFQSVFSNLCDAGQEVLAIIISEKMSGTLASAQQALEMLPGRKIKILDSKFSAMAQGFIVLAAARAAAQGANLAECVQAAEQARANAGVYFMVDNLKYLHMGGRIKASARFLGTALDLKPILHVNDGQIEPLERIRTSRKAKERLVALMLAGIKGKQHCTGINICVCD